MLNSDATIRAAQASRALSLPEQLDAPSPGREALLEGFRQRNALLDYLFYDIGCVMPDEARRIAPHWAAEGAILLVPQTGAGDLKLCTSVEGFVAAGGHALSGALKMGTGIKQRNLGKTLDGLVDVASGSSLALAVAGLAGAKAVVAPIAATINAVRGGVNTVQGYKRGDERKQLQGMLDLTRSVGSRS